MLKRLCIAVSAALTIAISNTQTTALAILPGTHTNPAISFQQTAAVTLAEQIASCARTQASAMCSVGFCYRGVKRALNAIGITLSGPAAWMAKDQLLADARFIMVPLKKLRKGDILVHDKSSAHPYGHIAVYLGNGQEASDHVQKLVLGGRYGNTTVFRSRDSHLAKAAEPDLIVAQELASRAANPQPATRVTRRSVRSARFQRESAPRIASRRSRRHSYALAYRGKSHRYRLAYVGAHQRGGRRPLITEIASN